jgi:hypothetical protein
MTTPSRHKVVAALSLAAVVTACGCSNGSNHAATPTQTRTVTKTVTLPATPRPRKRPPSPTFTTFTGDYFSVDYPDTWNVEASEVDKGGYLDSTIRSISDPSLMIRIDVTPGTSADAASSAASVASTLSGQPGYAELRFTPTSFSGYNAFDWVFRVRENGVLLEKQDTFIDDDVGNGVAILTQAPAGAFARWRPVFERVRSSLVLTPTSPPPPPAEPPPPASSEADFCSTHACIDSFYEGTGYIVQCNDGMWSHSGGLSGACSYHGGESGTTYP